MVGRLLIPKLVYEIWKNHSSNGVDYDLGVRSEGICSEAYASVSIPLTLLGCNSMMAAISEREHVTANRQVNAIRVGS